VVEKELVTLVERMVWIVHNVVELFIVTFFPEFRQIRRTEKAVSFASSQKSIGTLAVCRGNESVPCW